MEYLGGYLGQPQQLGLTPPHGRLGHSLPTPRILGGGPIVFREEIEALPVEPRVFDKPPKDLRLELSAANNVWLGNRRDPPKPPVSPLYQLRSPLYDAKLLESFKEEWIDEGHTGEGEEDQLSVLTRRLVIDTSCDSDNEELHQRFLGDSLNSVSYKPLTPAPPTGDDLGGSFVSAFSHSLNTSFTLPFVTSPTKDRDPFLYPTVTRNPNKAIVTIDARSSLILMTNEVTCDMFGYSKRDLVGLKIQHLFTEPYQSRQRALVEENIDCTGETVLLSGKVMEGITSYGLEFPVSVWMKRVSPPVGGAPDPRVIIVIEPVERCSIPFTVDQSGVVISVSTGFPTLFGYEEESDVIGSPIVRFIPSIVTPTPSNIEEVMVEQSLTGRTRDGSAFPLEVLLTGTSVEPIADEGPCSDLEGGATAEEGVVNKEWAKVLTHGRVVVYAALSGMVSFNGEGSIEGCNHHFALMLFGYTRKELLKKDITFILPHFHSHLTDITEEEESSVHPLFEQEVEMGPEISPGPAHPQGRVSSGDLFYSVSERSVSLDHALESHLASISEEGSDVFLSDPPNHTPSDHAHYQQNHAHLHHSSSPSKYTPLSSDVFSSRDHTPSDHTSSSRDHTPSDHASSFSDSSSMDNNNRLDSSVLTSGCGLDSIEGAGHDDIMIQCLPHVVTIGDRSYEYDTSSPGTSPEDVPVTREDPPPLLSSTPCRPLSRPTSRLSSAPSRGGGYPEGTYVGTVRHKDGSLMSVVFELKEILLRNDRLLYCMWITRQLDCGVANDDTSLLDHQATPDPLSTSMGLVGAQEEALATEGKYQETYETLGSIGRGAFGFVKLARRKDDNMKVVVKFIKKATVIKENWIDSKTMGVVPREICLLAQLSHPNIVQLLEAYENEQYFQLVMEKHGDGIDLFSFIEKGPLLDEGLVSYLFRQLVSGLSYLHLKHILHRDVKDENIILNHNFHVKIIDFGSAVLMEDGKLFNTFCGTLEYCSPEVLLGNSYAGPELEMWSLGVTLYTLVYYENPFFDVEEIISGRLLPPHLVSPGLMKIVLWLLHPDPRSRATLTDLEADKWVNQEVNVNLYSFQSVMQENKNKDFRLDQVTEELQNKIVNRSLS